MTASKIILFIIIILFIFLLGGGAGIVYQSQKAPVSQTPSSEFEKMSATLESLNSPIVASITAQGQVSKINGRDITMNYQGQELTIKIKDNAQVYSFIQSKKEKTTPNQVKFEDIKIKDNLNIAFKLIEGNQFGGEIIYILPAN